MDEKIAMELTGEELELVINALEILSPDEAEAQERLHALYGRLLAERSKPKGD